MKLTMHRATSVLAYYDVQRLLNERAGWMRARGSRQWAGDLLAPERIKGIVERGGTYLCIREDGKLAGTITVSAEGDPDFWTPDELAEPTWYLSKMATSLQYGRGLGGWMLRWAADQASQAGLAWCRLDVIRDEEARPLRDWYAAQGWEPVRTVVVPGKNSGALFRHPAAEDLDAREKFSAHLKWLERPAPAAPSGMQPVPGDPFTFRLPSGELIQYADPTPELWLEVLG